MKPPRPSRRAGAGAWGRLLLAGAAALAVAAWVAAARQRLGRARAGARWRAVEDALLPERPDRAVAVPSPGGWDEVYDDGGPATAAEGRPPAAVAAPPAGPPPLDTARLSKLNLLASRNWRHVTNCDTVDQKYFSKPTESRESPETLARWFTGCAGGDGGTGEGPREPVVLWIRSGSGKSDVSKFIEKVAAKLTRRFVLLSSDGDHSIPKDFSSGGRAATFLENPLLVRWYTQNYDGSIVHPKLRPLPVGFNFHTRPTGASWVTSGPTRKDENVATMVKIRDRGLRGGASARVRTLMIPPWTSYGQRLSAETAAASCPASLKRNKKQGMPTDELWRMYSRHLFALSPRGNGLDSHRTWELLFFGVVPIVTSSSLDPLFDGLPVVVVQDWTDICAPGFLERAWERVQPLWPAPLEAFTLQHWLRDDLPGGGGGSASDRGSE